MFVANHWLRFQLEQFLKFIGSLEPVERAECWPNEAEEKAERPRPEVLLPETRAVVVPGHFNLTLRKHGLPQLPAGRRHPTNKQPPSRRMPAEVDTLCYHQMAVAFGVSNKRVRHWADQASRLQVGVLEQYGGPDINDLDQLWAFARRIALHERVCKLPYHVAGLLNGDVVHINPLLWYTYHGNKANKRSLAIAADGHYPGLEAKRQAKHDDLDDFMINTMRAATRVAMVKADAANINIKFADAHRVYSSGRTGDPGEALWGEVVLWAVKEYGLVVRYDRKVDGGRPIPVEWDPVAQFNYRGRRIKEAS